MTAILGPGRPITLVAAADLSALQYQIVKLDTNGQAAAISAITDIPFGVLQNSPLAGENASVIPIGMGGSKIQLGGTLAAGALVATGATGKAVAAASTAYTIGILTEGGALDELGCVFLMPLTVKA